MEEGGAPPGVLVGSVGIGTSGVLAGVGCVVLTLGFACWTGKCTCWDPAGGLLPSAGPGLSTPHSWLVAAWLDSLSAAGALVALALAAFLASAEAFWFSLSCI